MRAATGNCAQRAIIAGCASALPRTRPYPGLPSAPWADINVVEAGRIVFVAANVGAAFEEAYDLIGIGANAEIGGLAFAVPGFAGAALQPVFQPPALGRGDRDIAELAGDFLQHSFEAPRHTPFCVRIGDGGIGEWHARSLITGAADQGEGEQNNCQHHGNPLQVKRFRHSGRKGSAAAAAGKGAVGGAIGKRVCGRAAALCVKAAFHGCRIGSQS